MSFPNRSHAAYTSILHLYETLGVSPQKRLVHRKIECRGDARSSFSVLSANILGAVSMSEHVAPSVSFQSRTSDPTC